ncbi:helix-turn-helix domain-containing protein [Oceanobacillus iheyensis]|uniref:helix-turn-helix domain-containing protein n=1 Tax=Oceanobacillus iheyensis TaxID=182710 RepID=UPI00363E4152
MTLDQYPDVLEPKDIQKILGIGQRQTYELLNQEEPPFHFVRIGRRIKIPKQNFIDWLKGASK